MAESQEPVNDRGQQPAPPAAPRVIRAEDLFRGERELWIEYEGMRYRLRITRRNRMILQK
jgi:hemin uptake protein HemP